MVGGAGKRESIGFGGSISRWAFYSGLLLLILGFLPSTLHADGGGATAAAGNFNGDAYQDLAVVDSTVGKTEIFLANGTGGFVTPPTIIPPTDPTYVPVSVAAGSFNSNTDAFDDLVVVEKTPDNITILSIYLGNGSGGFTLYKRRSVPGLDTATSQITRVESGSFNGDGFTDLAVTGTVNTQTNDVTLIVLDGDGNGNFTNTAGWPPVGSVVVSPALVYLGNSQGQTFTATVLNTSGNPMPGIAVNWTTTDATICPITPNGTTTDANGLVTANTTGGVLGTATITAYAGDPNDPTTKKGTASCNVVTPQPDVQAFSLTAQLSGGNLSVSTTVLNSGNVKLDSFRVGIYLSPDNVITPGSDILIGSRTVTDLQKGATSSATQLLPLVGIPTGNYYVGMYADDLFQISETNETNNAKASTATFTIGPNLQVYSLQATLSGANISVSDTIINSGNETATAPFDVNYYFSSDTTLDGGDTQIGSRTITSDLGANGTNSVSSLLPIPTSLSTGNYYVLAFVDPANAVSETVETDNTRATTGTYAIGPNLSVFSLSANLSGGNVVASDTEINQGNQPAGPFNVSFYLSIDTTLDGTDLLIGSRSLSGLGVNLTNSASTTMSLASVPAGNYYLCALSDSGNTVSETNEGNNSKCATTLLAVGPDLQVNSLTIGKSGSNVSVSDTELNSGNQAAGAATVTFYLSSNTTLDGGDFTLGSRSFPSLGINGSNSATTLFAPPPVSPGNYYVIAVTDSANVVAENNSTGTGETNNTKVSSTTVSLP